MFKKTTKGAREKPVDDRISIIRGLRKTLLMLFCCAVVACLYLYRDDLNAANFRRILNYIDLGGGASSSEAGLSIPLETGLRTSVRAFRDGFATLNCDTLRYVNGAGKEELAVQLAYEDPALLSGDRTLLAYDRGGLGYCVANSYAVLTEGQTTGAILGAGMSRDGAFALITNETGYRSVVTLMDESQREIYKWYTSAYYLVSVAVAEGGNRFAVAALCEEAGVFSVKILTFVADREEPVFTVSLGEEYPLALAYVEGETLAVVTEKGIRLLNGKGEETARFDAGETLTAVTAVPGSQPVVGWTDRYTGDARLAALTADGRLHERTLSESIRFVSTSGTCTAVMAGERIYLLNNRLENITEPFTLSGVRGLAAVSGGTVGAVYYDRMVVYG